MVERRKSASFIQKDQGDGLRAVDVRERFYGHDDGSGAPGDPQLSMLTSTTHMEA